MEPQKNFKKAALFIVLAVLLLAIVGAYYWATKAEKGIEAADQSEPIETVSSASPEVVSVEVQEGLNLTDLGSLESDINSLDADINKL